MTVDEYDAIDQALSAYTAHVVIDDVKEIVEQFQKLPFEESVKRLDDYNKDISEIFELALGKENLLIGSDKELIKDAYEKWRATYVNLKFNGQVYCMLHSI